MIEIWITNWGAAPKPIHDQPLLRIGPVQDRLNALLEENEVCGTFEGRRMTRIHDLLVREGFERSYDAVRR